MIDQRRRMMSGAGGAKGVALDTYSVGSIVFSDVTPSQQSMYGQTIAWIVADKGHSGYPAGSVTLLAEKIIKFAPFDAKEKDGTPGSVYGGYNKYLLSNVRQWLNKAGSPWYAESHQYDNPPSAEHVDYNAYSTEDGFLSVFSSRFAASILTTDVLSRYQNAATEICQDKVFLLSMAEIGFTPYTSLSAEGTKLAVFTSNATRIAYPTAIAVTNSDYTGSDLAANLPQNWTLRSAYINAGYSVYMCNKTGSEATWADAAREKHNIRPAINLPNSTMVDPDTGIILL